MSIRFTPSRCLDVRQDWYPMYYPEEMKARVSPVQSIEPHRILAPTRDSNQEPPGPESRVVTTALPLHTTPQGQGHSWFILEYIQYLQYPASWLLFKVESDAKKMNEWAYIRKLIKGSKWLHCVTCMSTLWSFVAVCNREMCSKKKKYCRYFRVIAS